MFDPNDLFLQMAARDIRSGSNNEQHNFNEPSLEVPDFNVPEQDFNETFNTANDSDGTVDDNFQGFQEFQNPQLNKLSELEKELDSLR